MKAIERVKMLATVLGFHGVYKKGTIYTDPIPVEVIHEIEAGARTVEVVYKTAPAAPAPSLKKEPEPAKDVESGDDGESTGGETKVDEPKKATPKKATPTLRRKGK
jgi:hypothetical protein